MSGGSQLSTKPSGRSWASPAGASVISTTSPSTFFACASRMIISSWLEAETFSPVAWTPYFFEKFSAISTILPVES